MPNDNELAVANEELAAKVAQLRSALKDLRALTKATVPPIRTGEPAWALFRLPNNEGRVRHGAVATLERVDKLLRENP